MNIPKLIKDLEFLIKLSDEPNDTDGLSADQFKSEFDKAGVEIQKYINEELLPWLEGANGAASVGVAEDIDLDGAQNVEEALRALKQAIVDSVAGNIPDGSLTGTKFKAGAIGTRELGEKSVTGAKAAEKTFDGSHIKNGGIKTENYSNESVDSNALGLESVLDKHIAPKAVDETKIKDGAVNGRTIAPKSLTEDKVADSARTQYVPMTIPVGDWVGANSPFEQRVPIPGIADGNTPTVSLSASAADEAQLEAFNAITLKATEDGSIVYESAEIPAVNIPVDVTHTIAVQTGAEWVSGDGVFTQEIAVEGLMATLSPNASYESDAITKLIAKGGVLEVTASSALEEAVVITITQTRAAEIFANAWRGTSAPFECNVENAAINALDRPKVYFAPPADFALLDESLEAFALLYDVEADEGTVKFYAKELPAVEFDVTLEVSRI